MTSLPSNSSRRPPIPETAGFGCDMPFAIPGPARNTKSTTKIYLTASRPWFGGRRWWFVCPTENRRVRKLYLPPSARRFRSRRAYRLAYASQREAVHDRAMRRARKLCRRLGDDPMDGHYPEKPPRMRWATYDRLLDKLIAANRIPDERMALAGLEVRGTAGPPDIMEGVNVGYPRKFLSPRGRDGRVEHRVSKNHFVSHCREIVSRQVRNPGKLRNTVHCNYCSVRPDSASAAQVARRQNLKRGLKRSCPDGEEQ
jgi:hypothetical protein